MQIDERSQRLYSKLSQDLGDIILNYLADDNVTEIMLNPDGHLWVDEIQHGQKLVGTLSNAQANAILYSVAGLNHLIISPSSPRLEAQFPHFSPMQGERLTAQLPPVVAAPSFTIRKRAKKIFSLENYLTSGRINLNDVALLKNAIIQRKNILVCGGPGSGKTTFTNALIQFAVYENSNQRFLLLEDTPELQCTAPNSVAMLTSDTVSMRDLLKSAMRMRPDRILIGEVRGAEALDMLKAWNTGCPGGICTIHANGPMEALQRVADLSLEAGILHAPSSLIYQTIDVVVFVRRHLNQSGFIHSIYQPTQPSLKENVS